MQSYLFILHISHALVITSSADLDSLYLNELITKCMNQWRFLVQNAKSLIDKSNWPVTFNIDTNKCVKTCSTTHIECALSHYIIGYHDNFILFVMTDKARERKHNSMISYFNKISMLVWVDW